MSLADVDRLLRDRAGVLARIVAGAELTALARAMLLTILAGGAVFGAAMGAYRGGWQIGFAAVKLPLVMLLTAALCAPALTALRVALGRAATLDRDLALVLASLALASLVVAALSPVIVLMISLDAPYHHVILAVTASCAIGGACALALLVRGLGAGEKLVAGGLVILFLLVGSQMAWTWRPYLERPGSREVVFVRDVEGNFLAAVVQASESARGRYRHDGDHDHDQDYDDDLDDVHDAKAAP